MYVGYEVTAGLGNSVSFILYKHAIIGDEALFLPFMTRLRIKIHGNFSSWLVAS